MYHSRRRNLHLVFLIAFGNVHKHLFESHEDSPHDSRRTHGSSKHGNINYTGFSLDTGQAMPQLCNKHEERNVNSKRNMCGAVTRKEEKWW